MGRKYIDGGDIDLDEEIVYDSRGNRITEARAEEMAASAIKYLDEERKAGRPSLSGQGKHSPKVQVRVSERTHDELARRAAAEGVSVSKLARRVLEDYLKAS